MKGFTHFISGIAAVSCLPGIVPQAMSGSYAPFILGGVSALLPDTLDFKIIRFFWKQDVLIVPDPLHPDFQEVAEAVAAAIDRAAANRQPLSLKLSSIQMSAESWQQYRLHINVAKKEIRVSGGPVVNTGQEPVDAGCSSPEGVARFMSDVKLDYLAETTIDIFDGPSFLFMPGTEKQVHIQFLPWHRSWTHSLLTAGLLGVFVLALISPLAGLAVFTGFTIHVLEDQMGHMGSQLFAPFSSRRYPGIGWMHALDVWPNVGTVWISLLIIYWNLALHAGLLPCNGNLLRYLFFGAGLPAAVAWWFVRARRGAGT